MLFRRLLRRSIRTEDRVDLVRSLGLTDDGCGACMGDASGPIANAIASRVAMVIPQTERRLEDNLPRVRRVDESARSDT
jgi:hypothetical protein